jgi:hypothetical protein
MTQPNWITQAGSLGGYPSETTLLVQLSAQPVLPATSVTYSLISGALPIGLTLTQSGKIKGTPLLVTQDTTYEFVIRATDNLSQIKDRTFTMLISGEAVPEFITPAGSVLSTLDSTWVELPIQYSNPANRKITVRKIQGNLPPGLEINSLGLIRGYAQPPIINVNLGTATTSVVAISSNVLSCLTTNGFLPGRPIIFSGDIIGGINPIKTYFVRSVINESSFTVSESSNGPELTLTNEVGYMNVTLPNITVGNPTVRTYTFTLKLESDLGSDLETYSIRVINQNASSSEGGPNTPPNSRIPTIFNTRPPTYDINEQLPYAEYYILPDLNGLTYLPFEAAYIGKKQSDDIFSFKIIGNDFDNNPITYNFHNLPLGLNGDSNTGWITGNPMIEPGISEFSFGVSVAKTAKPDKSTPIFNFSFILTNGISGDVDWITKENIGIIENSTVSVLRTHAVSDVSLQYRLVGGTLPPNLTLSSTGDIEGTVAYQFTDQFLNEDATATFTFDIEAYSPLFPVVKSTRTFTVTVINEYTNPTDTVYISCTPNFEDRNLIRSLLEDTQLIPTEYLYRPNDANFGKATNVKYVHAYGIYAADLDAYVEAANKNHYGRYITLGELKTAIARDNTGEIVYEVVYSKIIDNLVNPENKSVSKEIYWPRFIELNPGPGFARILYPNSLPNMREQLGDVLGQEFNFRLYPRWMTSQQRNGSTLGFTPAWVICYTKPGYAETIKQNIENNWKNPVEDIITLNQINFRLDRFTVDKSLTYDFDNTLNPPAWLGLPSGTPVPNPKDSKDFYTLFPRKTILPTDSQY